MSATAGVRRARWAVVAAACAAGVLLAPPSAAAGPRVIQPLDPNAKPSGSGLRLFRDAVIDHPPKAMAAVTRGLITRRYPLRGGGSIEITLSSSFPDIAENRSGAQSFANFLSSRLHNRELTKLRVFIGTEIEVAALCGGAPGVLACYSRGQQRMYVPDRDPPGGTFTREYAVTHEYGHHIAGNRSHTPFPALNFGAKYWSSYMHVCSRARRGILFPGNQTTHYDADPGEGFADTYAHLHYPSVIWQFAEIMRPSAGSFAAVRRDVRTPWTKPRLGSIDGSIRSAALRNYTVTQRLDGFLVFRLNGPPGTNYDLALLNQGQVLRQTARPGSRDVLTVLSCRAEGVPLAHLQLQVLRRVGSGPFEVKTSIAG